MLDLQFLCDNLDEVAENCRVRGVDVDLSQLNEWNGDRRSLIAETDQLRHDQKAISSQIPKASGDDRPALIAKGRELREHIQANEAKLKSLEANLSRIQSLVPNMTHPDAPRGDVDATRVIKECGERPSFSFAPKDHVDIAGAHDLIDFDAGSRVAGHGFFFLKNAAVLLELALIQYAVGKLREHGFQIMTTPDLARDSVLEGTGFLPRGPETQIYSIENTDLSLIATAEITLAGSLKNEVLDASKLPLRLAGISHCFRTEAGAHGRATRGIYRVHQFTKVEMFGFTEPSIEASNEFHEAILAIEEEIFQGLGIPYRVVDTATGDLGGPAYRKFDLEAWMPGRGDGGAWGEVTSASNCTDYQARRLGIRCRNEASKGTSFVHTLNGTAIASTRAIIAILENNQQEDGSVVIPEALRPWVGCERIG